MKLNNVATIRAIFVKRTAEHRGPFFVEVRMVRIRSPDYRN